jgi:hypothetical protein
MLDPRLTAKDPPPKRKCQYVRPGAPVRNARLQIRRPNRNRHHDGACGLARQPAHPTISNVSAALPRRFSLLTWTTGQRAGITARHTPKNGRGCADPSSSLKGPRITSPRCRSQRALPGGWKSAGIVIFSSFGSLNGLPSGCLTANPPRQPQALQSR